MPPSTTVPTVVWPLITKEALAHMARRRYRRRAVLSMRFDVRLHAASATAAFEPRACRRGSRSHERPTKRRCARAQIAAEVAVVDGQYARTARATTKGAVAGSAR